LGAPLLAMLWLPACPAPLVVLPLLPPSEELLLPASGPLPLLPASAPLLPLLPPPDEPA
jgi:hypothetical protein